MLNLSTVYTLQVNCYHLILHSPLKPSEMQDSPLGKLSTLLSFLDVSAAVPSLQDQLYHAV